MKTSWTSAQWVAFKPLTNPRGVWQRCPQGTWASGTRCWRGTSSRDRPREKPSSFAVLLWQPCCLIPRCSLGCSWDQEPGARLTPPAGYLPTTPDREQLIGAPDEPAHPPGGPQQDLKPSHEADGADKAHQLVVPLLLGSLELAGCFLRVLCALFGKWVEAPGAPSFSSCGERPLASPLGRWVWVQAGELGGCGNCWGCLYCWRQSLGSPLGVPESWWVFHTHRGLGRKWRGKSKTLHRGKGVVFFGLFFSSWKDRLLLRVWLILCDLWHHHGSAVWFVLQVKSSGQRFSSVLGSSQQYAFISPQKCT